MDKESAIRVITKHVSRRASAARSKAFHQALFSDGCAHRRDSNDLLKNMLCRDLSFARLAFPYENEISFHPNETIMHTIQCALGISTVLEKFIGKGKSGRIFETSDGTVLKLVCIRSYGNTRAGGHECAIDDDRYERYEIRNFLTEAHLQDTIPKALGGVASVPHIHASGTDIVRLRNNENNIVWTYGIVTMNKVDGVLSCLLENTRPHPPCSSS